MAKVTSISAALFLVGSVVAGRLSDKDFANLRTEFSLAVSTMRDLAMDFDKRTKALERAREIIDLLREIRSSQSADHYRPSCFYGFSFGGVTTSSAINVDEKLSQILRLLEGYSPHIVGLRCENGVDMCARLVRELEFEQKTIADLTATLLRMKRKTGIE